MRSYALDPPIERIPFANSTRMPALIGASSVGSNIFSDGYGAIITFPSFSNTELAKNDIQHVLDVDPSGDAAEGTGGGAQILGGELGKGGAGKPV